MSAGWHERKSEKDDKVNYDGMTRRCSEASVVGGAHLYIGYVSV